MEYDHLNHEEYNMGRVKVTARQVRRLGENLTGQEKFKRILAKRNYPPGLHGQKGHPRQSEFGIQLKEKQKMRYTYGLRDSQLLRYFKKALNTKGNTGDELLRLLERRLDNVVFRMGLATTRAQARQMVSHRHIRVNDRVVNIPSYSVKVGDKISVKEKSKDSTLVKQNTGREVDSPEWLDFDSKSLMGQIINLPAEKDLEVGFDTRLIIEFYSR